MKELKNLIPTQLKPEEAPENSEILTPEEIEETIRIALDEARRIKRVAINTEAYRKKIMAKRVPENVSAKQYYTWIVNKAEKEIKDFSLSNEEAKLYVQLSQYFTGDKEFEKDGLSLKKGIWLYGGVGCGKTTIMKLFRENPLFPYGVVESIYIADMYKDKEIGPEIIHRYSMAKNICFNDFGTEIESGMSSNYGNRKNVMAEIILNHYEKNEDKDFKFHATTNLGADEIEKHYGLRVRSRSREMFNIFSLEGVEDKRK